MGGIHITQILSPARLSRMEGQNAAEHASGAATWP